MGSINGGTVITITGKNFSARANDNLVYLSANIQRNIICNVIEESETEIKCVTPVRPDSDYSGTL